MPEDGKGGKSRASVTEESLPRSHHSLRRVTEVDSAIGKRVRDKRQALGLTQVEVADALGVTFQQVQKYERGLNRIPIARLANLSRTFEVPLDYFLGDAGGGPAPYPPTNPRGDRGLDREVLELIRAFRRIRSRQIRRKLVSLVKSAAEQDAPAMNSAYADREAARRERD